MKKNMNDDWSSLYGLIPENHLAVALDARKGKANVMRILFEKVSAFKTIHIFN